MSASMTIDRVTIRVAGDSGDGIQLAGDQLALESAFAGNAFATMPSYPAEIRAPRGSAAGTSSFQLQFADELVSTPGDQVDALVALNPAALATNLADVRKGGLVIVDTAEFGARGLAKAGYPGDPLTDGTLDAFQLAAFDLTAQTVAATAHLGLGRRDASHARNFYALGLLSWLYDRPTGPTLAFIARRWAGAAPIRDANTAAFQAGHTFGETSELFVSRYRVEPATMPPGTYRQITGNRALAYGLMAAAANASVPLFLGAYPITPASDVLHIVAQAKDQGAMTFQAEDEIAAAGAALGASFSGSLGVAVTSGPGFDLKTEMIGLAIMLELPLVVCDVQRVGPSTGIPTKPEQADLLQAIFGHHGETPLPVLAAATPGDCFAVAYEAARLAITYRTPVVVLSDASLANGSEPWAVPDLGDLPPIDPAFATEPNGPDGHFWPYLRDPDTLARPWALPGTPGLEHRIGGLEKSDGGGAINYTPGNHAAMTDERRRKWERIGRDFPPPVADDPGGARVLVVGWGSTRGAIEEAARQLRVAGRPVATLHLRHLNPLPAGLGPVLRSYDRVVVPEMNGGQLAWLLRAAFLVDVKTYSWVRGEPISPGKLAEALTAIVDEEAAR